MTKENKKMKKWYLSKTNVFGALNILSAVVGMFVPPWKDWMTAHFAELQGIIGAVIMFLRGVTKSPVE